jgi:hypothetical protein
MRGILQFDEHELTEILVRFHRGKHSIRETREAINARLREKAEAERELEESMPRQTRPNRF